jgi:hypothetical protein
LRTFEHEGEPDLSVVHIHCPEDPGTIDEPSQGQIPSDSGGQEGQTPPLDQSQKQDWQDYRYWSSNEAAYKSLYPEPTLPSLGDTDFEHELNVIFQISDQPRYFKNIEEAKAEGSRLNMDFLWTALKDPTMTKEEVVREQYLAGSASRSYRRTWNQVNNTILCQEANSTDASAQPVVSSLYGVSSYTVVNDWPSTSVTYDYPCQNNAFYWSSDIHLCSQLSLNSSSPNSPIYGGPWSGEVGRMVIWRAQTAPRDFMWTLHDEVETSDVVEKVEKRDVKKTKARKAS